MGRSTRLSHRRPLAHTASGRAPWPGAIRSELRRLSSPATARGGGAGGRCPMQMRGCGGAVRAGGPGSAEKPGIKKVLKTFSPPHNGQGSGDASARRRRHRRRPEPPPPRPPQLGARAGRGRGAGTLGARPGVCAEKSRAADSRGVCPPRGSSLACAPRRGGRLQD